MPEDAVAVDVLVPDVFKDVPGIAAGFSGRHGGVSTGPYASLNLGLSTGDVPDVVLANRIRFSRRFGLSVDQMAIAGQVHGAEVIHVEGPGLYRGFDGLVTTSEGAALCITAADCAVVLLADRKARVIGACHSGWRGTVARIAQRTVAEMQRRGARPESIRAYIGPCISAEHFEVGPEVAAQFEEQYVAQRPEWSRPHVDLKAVIHDQLVEAGLHDDAIEVSPRCTFAETQDFYSYRAEEGKTGRMMGLICLTDE